MLFTQGIYFAFLAVVLLAYYCLSTRYQNRLLLIASYVFYGYWDWRFLSLLFISTVVDFFAGKALADATGSTRRKFLMGASLSVNLGILGFFKYFDFFTDSAENLLRTFGMAPDVPTLELILPVGISFYTFQTLAYTFEVYRGRLSPCRDFADFALYVSFFPQLVAGPIERPQRLLPQIQSKRNVDSTLFVRGLILMGQGYIKKAAIADSLAPVVDGCFSDPSQSSGLVLLAGLYAFSLQIYCDFSGYSDIARGTACLLGIDLMVNFKQPYLASNITGFWRRWHISLSTWLRDYLYIPLGGNRRGHFRTYRNLMITMLLGGLWHGASWTFVAWGGLHGFYLALHRAWLGYRGITRDEKGRFRWARVLVTFHLVSFTWVFFRAGSFSEAWSYLSRVLTWADGVGRVEPILFLCVLLVALLDLPESRFGTATWVLKRHWFLRGTYYAATALLLLFLVSHEEIPFIYFQF